MRTLLCRFRLPSHTQPRHHNSNPPRGQVIVIFAVTLLALLFFTGLAIDSGSLYVTYSQLRRSIDAAAVAAANDYKAEYGAVLDTTRMKKAAIEVMKMHDINETDMDLKMYLCGDSGAPAEFVAQCPGAGEPGRKLIWIDATLKAPLYFLSLLGFHDVPLRAHAISEAAPIDLVIVIDSSESMADQTPGYSTPYDPSACNAANNCDPFFRAKDAANSLIDTMFEGYDQVAIVNFDVSVKDINIPANNMGLKTLADAKTLVDA
ncbi:MAG TPA: vWA domain-containing protein, partial [Leptolinea sp.]